MATRDKLWAFTLIANFLRDNGLENTLSTLIQEAQNEMEDMENTVLPTHKPLLGILDDVKFLIMKQKMENVHLER